MNYSPAADAVQSHGNKVVNVVVRLLSGALLRRTR